MKTSVSSLHSSSTMATYRLDHALLQGQVYSLPPHSIPPLSYLDMLKGRKWVWWCQQKGGMKNVITNLEEAEQMVKRTLRT